jgi:hypothetical protein
MTYTLALALVVALCLLAAPTVLGLYLQRLPVAPDCPCCRALTREASIAALSDRWVGTAVATMVRECTSCGWRGRMRWRWAPSRMGPNGT